MGTVRDSIAFLHGEGEYLKEGRDTAVAMEPDKGNGGLSAALVYSYDRVTDLSIDFEAAQAGE